ncbi:hypothetical protein [uncultured Tissierella sp.]|uniref:hypothetical protein n=1 Tax=uncultured Tissierella sp. TaxID=448160 RepID=UPI002803C823|nr:hypothetical protein [uncultured Tissierella sp.]MDU5080236.1 hypothetical protein [Bacillota bacterium]
MADNFKVYSYKAYKFEKKEAGKTVESVSVPPLTFSTVPEWVRNTAFFNLALKDGSIVIVESKNVEKNTEPSELEQLKAKAKELGLKGYGNYGIQKLREVVANAEAGKESGKEAVEDKEE